jgi:ribose 5-phosphate isomerase A
MVLRHWCRGIGAAALWRCVAGVTAAAGIGLPNPKCRRAQLPMPLTPRRKPAYKADKYSFRSFAVTHSVTNTAPDAMSAQDRAKQVCANRAAAMVETGMKVGLGTGSTAAFLVKRLGERVRDEGLEITAVATSTRTADLARAEGISVVSLDQAGWLDLTIDGADEFDGDLRLIKGGGGAHLQELVVATASDRMVVITDGSKRVDTLGAFPLPVEVLRFGMLATQKLIAQVLADHDVAGRDITPRMNGDHLFVSDEGNYILDLHLGRIGDAAALSNDLNQIAGVVENGLFLNICDQVVVGYHDGTVEIQDVNGITNEIASPTGDCPDNIFRG